MRALKQKSRTKTPSLQATKSAHTRGKVVDATIRCIIRFGYANITTPKIAAEAHLSRGAMRHHFRNGAAIIKAAVIELHERRLRAFRRTSETENHDPGTMVQVYWNQLQNPTFLAFHELALAARTSPKLARILLPLEHEFRERFLEEAFALFPEWSTEREGFAIAMTFSQTFLEGMAIRVLNDTMDEKMVPPMLKLVENQIRSMNPAFAKDSAAAASGPINTSPAVASLSRKDRLVVA
jgi:AcrR family transcriptional regulator